MESDKEASIIPFHAEQVASNSELVVSIMSGTQPGTLDNVVATGKILQEVLVDSNVGSHRSTFSDISMVSKVRSFLLYSYLLGCVHLLHQILTLFTAYR